MATGERNAKSLLTGTGSIVGLVAAIVVVVLHLAIGLGPFWPVAAAAVWGASLVLLPSGGAGSEAGRETDERLSTDATFLESRASAELEALLAPDAPEQLADAARRFGDPLTLVLSEWEHLDDYPEQKVVVAAIVQDHLSALVAAYGEVPQSKRDQAVAPTADSLDLLAEELRKIHRAVGEDDLRALQNQRDVLAIQFGRPDASELQRGQGPGDAPVSDGPDR